MSNIASFLRQRELGSCNRKFCLNDKIEDFYDGIASKPVINKACSLSRRCRATFLVDFSPDGTKVASTHGDHSVRITEIATGKCTHVLEGHPRTPWCVAFHPSSNEIVASGCLHGEVRIWDLFGGGSEVWRLQEHSVIASLAFHPTDNLLVFASVNTIYFWDWSKPEPFAYCKTKHDYERIRWIGFHPLGQYLYTGITNTTTLHQSNSSRVSFINGSGRSNQSQRTRGLSSVYDNLVECFQTYQRDRVINLATAGSGHVGNDQNQNQSEFDSPPSPVHAEGLSLARQYARHITETAASEAAQQVIIPPTDPEQGPSTSTGGPSVISEDLSWSPPPRINNEEELPVELMLEPSPICIVSAFANDPLRSSSTSVRENTNSSIRDNNNISSADNNNTISSIDNNNISSARDNNYSSIRDNNNISSARDNNSTSSARDNNSTSSARDNNNTSSFGDNRSSVLPRAGIRQLVADFRTRRNFTLPSERAGSSSGPASRFSHKGGSSSGPASMLDHSNCDGHCDVCGNYNLSIHHLSNQSSLQSRQERLENRRRYCRNRLSAIRRRQNDLTNLRERSSSRTLQRLRSELLQSVNQRTSTNSSAASSNQTNVTVIQAEDASVSSSRDNLASSMSSSVSSSALADNYDNIRSNFVSITTRLEQEMNELDRRINDLRNSFQESIRQLQVHHGVGGNGDETAQNRDVPLNSQVTRPVITVTRCRESHDNDQNRQENRQTRDRTHLLETALRTSVSSPRMSEPTPPVVTSSSTSRFDEVWDSLGRDDTSGTWSLLQRHHLHPHYSVSILDETINRPQDAVQRAINHTIAGAFMGRGEAAVASNIVNQTYRIQQWDLLTNPVPDITDDTAGIVVPNCKLHNDASCDISQDGTMLATFVPSHRGFPDDNIMAVYSLRPDTFAQCLYTKSFGPNAISVSISPRNQHVLVGLAAKRLIWVFTTNQLVAQIYKLDKQQAGENSTKHVTDIMHPCDIDVRSHVSVNSARWLPTPGYGIVYGTNRGDLQISKPGSLQVIEEGETTNANPATKRNLINMFGGMSRTPVTVNSIATQTPAVRRSMSTQTEESDSNVIV